MILGSTHLSSFMACKGTVDSSVVMFTGSTSSRANDRSKIQSFGRTKICVGDHCNWQYFQLFDQFFLEEVPWDQACKATVNLFHGFGVEGLGASGVVADGWAPWATVASNCSMVHRAPQSTGQPVVAYLCSMGAAGCCSVKPDGTIRHGPQKTSVYLRLVPFGVGTL